MASSDSCEGDTWPSKRYGRERAQRHIQLVCCVLQTLPQSLAPLLLQEAERAHTEDLIL